MSATTVERLREFRGNDLQDLCDAAEEGIKAGGGFGWLTPPHRPVMESYWRGVMLIPDRMLFVGRLDGVIAGTAQLLRPPKNNEAQARSAHMTTHFVAPWARGHGLARGIVLAVEEAARAAGALVLNLDVRETQEAASSSTSRSATGSGARTPTMPALTTPGSPAGISGRTWRRQPRPPRYCDGSMT